MSSVLARYEVSGERRNPNPSGSTSSVPSPKIASPFFARFLRIANMRSCLRRRFAPSISFVTAKSTSCVTCWDFSSDKCMANAEWEGNVNRGVLGRRGRTATGCWDLPGAANRPALMLLSAPAGGLFCRTFPKLSTGGAAIQCLSVRPLHIAVKERGELRFRERADLGGLDVAVLEQHQ